MPTLTEYMDANPDARPKKKRNFEEHNLQAKLKVFAREFIVGWHKFAAHDRSQNWGTKQHIFEEQRGILADWPDTEIDLDGGATWRCELKAFGKSPNPGQQALAEELTAHGHVVDWADCAVMWLAKARAFGIQFRPGADARASTIDALLTAARTPKAPKKARAGKPRQARHSAAAMGRIVQRQIRFGV